MGIGSQVENRVGDVVSFGWTPEGSRWVQNTEKYSFQSSWVNNTLCLILLGDRSELLAENHFCAREHFERASVCHGDLGAGFVLNLDSHLFLTGVLSVVTNMCNPSIPALYTILEPYWDWIYSISDAEPRY